MHRGDVATLLIFGGLVVVMSLGGIFLLYLGDPDYRPTPLERRLRKVMGRELLRCWEMPVIFGPGGVLVTVRKWGRPYRLGNEHWMLFTVTLYSSLHHERPKRTRAFGYHRAVQKAYRLHIRYNTKMVDNIANTHVAMGYLNAMRQSKQALATWKENRRVRYRAPHRPAGLGNESDPHHPDGSGTRPERRLRRPFPVRLEARQRKSARPVRAAIRPIPVRPWTPRPPSRP